MNSLHHLSVEIIENLGATIPDDCAKEFPKCQIYLDCESDGHIPVVLLVQEDTSHSLGHSCEQRKFHFLFARDQI